MSQGLTHTLQTGLAQLGLDLPQAAQNQLVEHLMLVQKWNKIYNLTAVRDVEKMVTHHVLDSLAVVPHIAGAATLLDVGSGAGLPGIPLAIACPELQVILLDSNQKKTTFLRQVKMQLALANVTVVCDRVEKHKQNQLLSVIISRAFAELADFADMAGHLLAPGGKLIAMKGADPAAEISRLDGKSAKGSKSAFHRFVPSGVAKLNVPGLDAERHLVFLKAA